MDQKRQREKQKQNTLTRTKVEKRNQQLERTLLNIPIKMAVKWEDRGAMDILQAIVDKVSYPLGDSDRYIDQSKDILKLILLYNDDVSTDSDEEVDDVLK